MGPTCSLTNTRRVDGTPTPRAPEIESAGLVSLSLQGLYNKNVSVGSDGTHVASAWSDNNESKVELTDMCTELPRSSPAPHATHCIHAEV